MYQLNSVRPAFSSSIQRLEGPPAQSQRHDRLGEVPHPCVYNSLPEHVLRGLLPEGSHSTRSPKDYFRSCRSLRRGVKNFDLRQTDILNANLDDT